MNKFSAIFFMLAIAIFAGCQTQEEVEDIKMQELKLQKEKEDFINRMELRLDQFDLKIDELSQKAKQTTGQTQQELEAEIDELKKQKDNAREKLETLDVATEDTWEELKLEVESEIDAVENSIKIVAYRIEQNLQ